MDLPHTLSSTSPQLSRLLEVGLPSTDAAPSRKVVVRKLQSQHRLSAAVVTELLAAYQAGGSVSLLAKTYELHRTTVLNHLKRAGINRRPWIRKLSDGQVQRAAALYASGASLAAIGEHFQVDATTIRNEFTRAGLPVRPRRGW